MTCLFTIVHQFVILYYICDGNHYSQFVQCIPSQVNSAFSKKDYVQENNRHVYTHSWV
ncbi:hypothetical protein CCYN2B_330024 [Capnocytophaga cynodegmi]|uniref:Uncharacterized protein n=1 Tax=Capnocytophaga cynodegmi TaxID=28189 RepID=A0A0B7HGW6_9FLAO|nr:hypothetical protein CCYN2B_330024 [Capnocytophaga cynodegmi]